MLIKSLGVWGMNYEIFRNEKFRSVFFYIFHV